ncbi:mobilization protein [Burkholderia ubonensis]|nr:mobilization protein [Burkholderia ubonensis]KVL73325.1 mobilization protein [Burkholderia ubonensis]KVL91153.1 mobilization protein [Burkholderia ubonensis]
MSADDLNVLAEPKRRGRKKAQSALGKPVSTRLTDEQWRIFNEKVERSGMSSSEFLRDCILTNRTQIVARPPATVERQRILFVINKTGNNLNQLAHVANTARVSGKLSESTFVALVDELEMITQLLKAHLHRVD